MAEESEVNDLEILSLIGFDGKTPRGLVLHPDDEHILYPFGNSVTIQNMKTRQQDFLRGHTNIVSAVALSPSGIYIASGQINHMGFKTRVILWDFDTRTQLSQYEIHKVRIESLAFSCDDSYFVSLGGRDDNNIIVYDVKNREPICGTPSSGANAGIGFTVTATRRRSRCFLTAGDRTLRLWKINPETRKVTFIEVNCNKVKRIINCIALDENDELAYCGTSSGDIIKIAMNFSSDPEICDNGCVPVVIGVFGKIPIKKKGKFRAKQEKVSCYSQGVTAILVLEKGRIIVGAGDGTVEEIVERKPPTAADEFTNRLKEPVAPLFHAVRRHNVGATVTTMVIQKGDILIATSLCEMITIGLKKWDLKLIVTGHTSAIYDVCFPSDLTTVLATCSKDSVRLWNTETSQELLRITVANMTCSGVVFQPDGRGVLTSWNDGKIRAFTPQTGRLLYIIQNAHNKGVSALAVTNDGKTIVSGGGEGQVRVWEIRPTTNTLKAVLQEHKGPVSAIHINYANDEAASASTDGSCIIWDIMRCARKNIIFSNTLFMAVRYHPSDSQILTAGTSRKISYWESFDGSLIRDLEGSASAAVNTIDISPCGGYFVTAGNDQMVKVWKYEEGEITHVGLGHSAIITQARYSPEGKYIITVSADGALFRWKNPHYETDNKETKKSKKVKELETVRSEPKDVVEPTPRESVKNSV